MLDHKSLGKRLHKQIYRVLRSLTRSIYRILAVAAGKDGSYGTSVERYRALDPASDIILAFKQNGRLLTPDHGYPLRIIIPGAPSWQLPCSCSAASWILQSTSSLLLQLPPHGISTPGITDQGSSCKHRACSCETRCSDEHISYWNLKM